MVAPHQHVSIAILVIDMKGYGDLAAVSAEELIDRFSELLRSVILPAFRDQAAIGHKDTGDGAYGYFKSVVNALRAGIEVQQWVARNKPLVAGREVRFRIGIDFGDAVADGGEFRGYRMVRSARIEAHAEPGGICLSKVAREMVDDGYHFVFQDLGECSTKQGEPLVHIYQLVPGDPDARKVLGDEGEQAALGLGHPLLPDFLKWLYRAPLWVREGVVFPAVVYQAGSSVLASWRTHVAKANARTDWAAEDRGLVELRRRAGHTIENRQTFCVSEVVVENGVATVRSDLIGEYEDCLATCDALERELLVAFGSAPPGSSDPDEFQRFAEARLPLRCAMMSFAKRRGLSPLLTGAGRSAAAAVSTLTLAKMPGGTFVTFLGHRSGKTATHPKLLHLAPSGMLQPIWPWDPLGETMSDHRYAREWDLRNHILREVAEELFSADFEKQYRRVPPETPGVISSNRAVAFLEQLLDSGGAQIIVTGMLVNLLNLRAEISTILLITDPKWYRCHDHGIDGLPNFGRNWEFSSIQETWKAKKRDYWHSPIWSPDKGDLSEALIKRMDGVTLANFVLPGAVTLLLGLERVRSGLLKDR